MKPAILLIFSALLFPLSSFSPAKLAGEELKWEEWNSGYPKAVKDKKIALVDAYTDWCGWCKRMDKDTYANPDIIKKINKHFVPIKFNPELSKTYTLDGQEYSGGQLLAMLSQNRRTGYPTTFFIITSKNTVYAVSGYEGPEKFSQTLDNILASANEQPAATPASGN